MRITYYLFFIPILLASFLSLSTCGDNKEIIKRTKDGRNFEIEVSNGEVLQIRELDSLGNLYSVDLFDNDNLTFRDSSVYYRPDDKTIAAIRYFDTKGNLYYEKQYEPDGRLSGEGGLTNNENMIGMWTYYFEDGTKLEQAEYIALNDSTHLNNAYAFTRDQKDTVLEYSKFYQLKFAYDTITVGETVSAQAILRAPHFRELYPEVMVLLPYYDETENFTSNFDNEGTIRLDTTWNMNLEEEYRRQLNITSHSSFYDKLVVFGKRFRKTGAHKFRGILVEYAVLDTASNGDILTGLNKTYFEKDIFVTDTVN